MITPKIDGRVTA